MATITARQGKDGKPRYTAQIRTKGHSEAKTFSTKTAAREWAKRREVELKEKPHLAASEAHKHTLNEAVERYVADYLPRKSSSMIGHQTRQLAWWTDHYGHLPLTLVQPPILVEARDILAKTPKQRGKGTLSPASVNRHLAAIGIVLSTAHREWHWIAVNPMEGVSKLRENNQRTRYLDDDGAQSELVRLLDACRISESEHLYAVVLMALTTGARAQEVLGLQWNAIDFDVRTVVFKNTEVRDIKNRTARTVGLADEVADLLRPRRGPRNGLVFPGPRNPNAPADIRSAWETALRRAGIENFRFHDLRHTAATFLLMEGASLAELAGVLGHKTLSMVKRYAHSSDEHTAAVSTRIAWRVAAKTGCVQ